MPRRWAFNKTYSTGRCSTCQVQIDSLKNFQSACEEQLQGPFSSPTSLRRATDFCVHETLWVALHNTRSWYRMQACSDAARRSLCHAKARKASSSHMYLIPSLQLLRYIATCQAVSTHNTIGISHSNFIWTNCSRKFEKIIIWHWSHQLKVA